MKKLFLLLFTFALSFLSFGISVEITNDVVSWKYSHDVIMYHELGASETPIVKIRERIHDFKNNLIDNNISYKKMLSTKVLSKNKQFDHTSFFSCHNLE